MANTSITVRRIEIFGGPLFEDNRNKRNCLLETMDLYDDWRKEETLRTKVVTDLTCSRTISVPAGVISAKIPWQMDKYDLALQAGNATN